MKTLIILMSLVLLVGCSDSSTPEAPAKAQNDTVKGNIETTIDGVTGRSAVKQGKQAMNKIEAISSQKNKDLNEVEP